MRQWIERLFFLFVFLIPWNARWVIRAGEIGGGFWEYGTVALYATDVLFFAIVLLILIAIAKKDFRLQIADFKIFTYCLLLTAYVLLSISWSFDRPVAFYAALKFLEGVMLFLLVRFLIRSDQKTDRLDTHQLFILAFVASAVVQSVLAIAQFFTQSVFAWSFSGIAPQDPSDLGVAVVQFADERWLRAYGSFPHPNLLGAFLVVALIIVTPLIPLILRGRKMRYLLLTAYCLLLTGLFFTFSRAAWIATLLGVMYWVLKTHAWRDRFVRQILIVLTVYCLLLTAIFFPLVKTRVVSSERLEAKSNIERVEGYREAVQLIKAHPLLGVGIGNYTAAVARELRPNDPAWSYQPVHNVFLLILSELGLIGLLFFITPFIPLTLRGRRGVYSLPLILMLAILASFDHSLWTLHSGILLAWFALSMEGA